jgi:hypothetical protein
MSIATDAPADRHDGRGGRSPKRRSRRRPLLVGVIALVVVAFGLVVLDRVATSVAERRAAERVESEIGSPVNVTFHGWPTGLRLLTGEVQRAEVLANDVHLEESGATLDRLDVVLENVRVGWRDVVNPPADLPPTESGTFEARLSGDATWALASIPAGLASLEIADGAVRLRTLLADAAADLIVVDGTIRMIPRTAFGILLSAPVSIDLSDQPGDPRIEDAWIDDDTLVLRGSLRDVYGE